MAAPIAYKYNQLGPAHFGTWDVNDANPTQVPGSIAILRDGSQYQYIQATNALILGDSVFNECQSDDTSANMGVQINNVGGYAAGYAGTIAFNVVGSGLPAAAVNSYQGWYATVNVDNVAQEGDTYRIATNTATTFTLDRGLDTLVANGNLITIWAPWRVTRTTATTQELQGIAMGTVSAGNYSWILKKGDHYHARYRTGTVATQVLAVSTNLMTRLAPSATAGALGQISATSTTATTTQLDAAFKSHAAPLIAMVGTTAATRYLPVRIDCPIGSGY